MTRRFISADGQLNSDSLLGFNMFAYCENNPVMYVDPTGEWPWLWGRPYGLGLGDLIIRVLCMTLGSQEESVYYDVPLYNQGDSELCWAYSQAMIEDYNSGIWRSKSGADKRVREIVVETRGFYKDEVYSPSSIRDLTRIESPIDLYNALIAYGPLYAEYDLWDQKGDRVGGHAIVITGINVERGLVFTNNPWGKRGIQTFDEFQRGFVGCKDDGWLLMAYYYLEQGA